MPHTTPVLSARTPVAAGPAAAPLLAVVGAELVIPLVDGRRVHARGQPRPGRPARRPCVAVAAAVDDLLPWSSSVHRGAGFPSVVCTELLAGEPGISSAVTSGPVPTTTPSC